MKDIFLFLLIIAMINNKEPNSKLTKTYKVSDIIELIKFSDTVGYKIIDPDDFIKKSDQKKLVKQLKEVYKDHKVNTFIVVIRNAYLKDKNGEEIDLSNFTQLLIDEIYDRKIINKKSSAIVAVFSIEGKTMSMKTKGGVSQTITQQDCFNILSIINNYFSYGEYSYGTVELANIIKYYLVNTGFFSRNKRFFMMILLLIGCFIFCYLLAFIAQKIKERRIMRLTMSDEEKLLKIREFLKKTKVNRKILSDSCIICLDSFENCTSITHTLSNENRHAKKISSETNDILIDIEKETNVNTNANTDNIEIEMNMISNRNDNENNDNQIPTENNNNNINYGNNNIINQRNPDITDNQISTLPCGHRYHVKCITQWMMQRKNICPMCREKIDVDIPEIDEEDLQNELLNIQIELHPAFALLVFQTINEELTWGAITLPAINGGLFSGLSGFAFI